MKTNKPEWWPENPYPDDIFPMTDEEYVAAVPDEKLRTSISGCLGRMFWNIASQSIFEVMVENIHTDDYREAIGCAPAIPGSISAEEAVRRGRGG